MKEKLKSLYQSGALSPKRLLSAIAKGWVTTEDVVDIVGEDNAAEVIRDAKIAEISATCNVAIVSGIDVKLGKKTEHFNLSIEDQSNIANLFRVVELGGTEFPYQADGGACRIYTAQEIVQIYMAAQGAITSQTTYHNALKAYVQSLTDVETISAVTYGMELPAEYAAEMNTKLKVAQTQIEAIVARLNSQDE